MNRIDVSAIQPNPSKFFTTDHEEENLTKRSQQEEQLQYSIKPLQQNSQSFLVDHGSNSRRHTIFKEYERLQTVKSEAAMSTTKAKIQFKIPAIEDYYIKQSKENINPNKVHRMESMIYTQQRDDRTVETQAIAPVVKETKTKVKRRWVQITIIIVVLAVLLIGIQRTSESMSSYFSESLPKNWKLF